MIAPVFASFVTSPARIGCRTSEPQLSVVLVGISGPAGVQAETETQPRCDTCAWPVEMLATMTPHTAASCKAATPIEKRVCFMGSSQECGSATRSATSSGVPDASGDGDFRRAAGL